MTAPGPPHLPVPGPDAACPAVVRPPSYNGRRRATEARCIRTPLPLIPEVGFRPPTQQWAARPPTTPSPPLSPPPVPGLVRVRALTAARRPRRAVPRARGAHPCRGRLPVRASRRARYLLPLARRRRRRAAALRGIRAHARHAWVVAGAHAPAFPHQANRCRVRQPPVVAFVHRLAALALPRREAADL
jgi:hypothetical protein